ncbi:uncharacterized protein BCR38DRAFT_117921 [Pseudomassariella vexata]|uniref:Uncharacterized protein n=1 Tax=Pseudomassariella vexata TaxID=1141098 RepID=A0A1Y2DCG1_9PEZI|nr:uncharacterized protein BCR38DRAFT_117921 [Pseudomassariella vexata]ORY56365.1 hypothetical protein BCR38DRAFT_117921 [Pseudomassariella vexata]
MVCQSISSKFHDRHAEIENCMPPSSQCNSAERQHRLFRNTSLQSTEDKPNARDRHSRQTTHRSANRLRSRTVFVQQIVKLRTTSKHAWKYYRITKPYALIRHELSDAESVSQNLTTSNMPIDLVPYLRRREILTEDKVTLQRTKKTRPN